MNKLWLRLVIFIFLLIFFIGGSWFWWNDAISPANLQDKKSQIFIIKSGESARNIATRLKNVGLIRDQIGFFLLVKLNKSDSNLQAGDFHLNPSMSAKEIMNKLFHGSSDVQITIKEGVRIEEIATVLAQDLNIPESEFTKQAKEGYMFPETYFVYKDATAGAVIKKISDQFNSEITPKIAAGIKVQKLTLNEGLILASIVEREGVSETVSETDRPIIAGILIKRLENDWPLQVDATIQYMLGYQSDVKTWWKTAITNEDKKIKSPYNTYINTGLPPAPICNPGRDSIKAVAFPQITEYWYYLHGTDGQAHYAKTLEEHEANVLKYL